MVAVLLGRSRECAQLDGLLDAVRAGGSRALVVRGEPGIGKSALLEYLGGRAEGCRVARVAGVQSEMELPYAGLQQLCAGLLDGMGSLPPPQAVALETAFGLGSGVAPDRFIVGLAVLGLLAAAAEPQPLVCLVDDLQWLDQASAQALAFVARRLTAESVAIVFALRDPRDDPRVVDVEGLRDLPVRSLGDQDARALLTAAVGGPLDDRVRDRIVLEARGNPFALLELPRGLVPGRLAGGFGLPEAANASGPVEASLLRRLDALPAGARRLLLVAAVEPTRDSGLLWRAAGRLGIGTDAGDRATESGLAEIDGTVRFRHPIVRSVVYRAASPRDRRAAHAALAEVTDRGTDPDRRAWHLAHAAAGLDDAVAAELERSAGRAQARGGLAAAAAFYERAAMLTTSPEQRSDRALQAASARHQAGDPAAALALVASVRAGPLDQHRRARVDLVTGHIAVATGRADGARLLHEAAIRFEQLDLALARETHLSALAVAVYASARGDGTQARSIARAARAAPAAPTRTSTDLLLDALALLVTDGYLAAVTSMQQAARTFLADDVPGEVRLRWGWLASMMAAESYDSETLHLIAARHVQLARDAGALTFLPFALHVLIGVHVDAGNFSSAHAALAEAAELSEATAVAGGSIPAALAIAAFDGTEVEFWDLVARSKVDGGCRNGHSPYIPYWASAVFLNGLGRHDEALIAARTAREQPLQAGPPLWVLPELVEAAVRCGATDSAADAMDVLGELARAAGTDLLHGVAARSRALLNGPDPEPDHLLALELLQRTRVRREVARAHLLYGEWLRRRRRRRDAREQLQIAYDMLTGMGATGFAERAHRELLATGSTARRRSAGTLDALTAREAQIARLARDGLSNPEIGTRLFVSPRTVEYHLAKIFTKLGIASRLELDRALS